MLYPALLPLMRTPRLPVVDWTYAPADLNGLVLFAGKRNLVSARVSSHFNWPPPIMNSFIESVINTFSVQRHVYGAGRTANWTFIAGGETVCLLAVKRFAFSITASRYNDSLPVGRCGDQIQEWVKFSSPIETCPTSFCTMGSGPVPGVKTGRTYC